MEQRIVTIVKKADRNTGAFNLDTQVQQLAASGWRVASVSTCSYSQVFNGQTEAFIAHTLLLEGKS